eukprot:9497332-Pyramimonas_sp.AAC.1
MQHPASPRRPAPPDGPPPSLSSVMYPPIVLSPSIVRGPLSSTSFCRWWTCERRAPTSVPPWRRLSRRLSRAGRRAPRRLRT